MDIGKYYKITDSETGLAWTIKNASMDNTAQLVLEEYTGADNQLFYMEEAETEGQYLLKMKHSELYLTVNEDGNITQEERNSAKNQIFMFELIEDKKSISIISKWFEEHDEYKKTGISYNIDDDDEIELCCIYKNGDVEGFVAFENDNIEYVTFMPEGCKVKLMQTENRGVLAVGCVNNAGVTEVYDVVFEDGVLKLVLFAE